MIIRIGRIIATVVAIVGGLFVLADLFAAQWPGEIFNIPGFKQTVNGVGFFLVSWTAIVVAFALFLGLANVISVHWHRIRTRKPGSIYSIVLLASLMITLIMGYGGPASENGQRIFKFVLQPLEATFFSLLAVFIATAAFRAFRVRSLETFFFVLFAVIVLLGQVPVSIYIWPELPVIKDWILDVPTLAGVRGILLGVALGTIATGLRVFIGADRPYTD
ncbi:MAG: hypothetical protein JW953_19600 [Anaerolineae bacterium]|nr:hypothetical protein [Anaerolineae bacterium]